MTFTYRPAVREKTPLLIGLAGPSGSGKTYSALRLAHGLAAGGPVFMLDTESRRGLHYAGKFSFQHGDLTAPFRPDRYLAGLEAAKKAGAAVIVVDSMSHEHEGPGGILEWHEEELQRMSGGDQGKAERVKFAAWIKPKQSHNKLVNSVLQLGVHCIFCFRAKEKLKLVKDQRGKLEPVPQGWQPICSDRFEYEMTMLLMLPPNSGGVPELDAPATKLQEQHRAMIQAGQKIDEAMGGRLLEWANGGVAPQPRTAVAQTETTGDPVAEAEAAARQGSEAFTAWWNGPGKTAAKRAAVKPHMARMKKLAEDADAAPAVSEEDEDPFGGSEGEGDKPADPPATDHPADKKPADEKPADPPPAQPAAPAHYPCVDETGHQLATDGSPASFVKALDGCIGFPGLALKNRQTIWRANFETTQRVLALGMADLGAELERIQRLTLADKAA